MKKSKEEKKVCEFYGYTIYSDKRQYICVGPVLTTYQRTLTDCFSRIRETELRFTVAGSKDLDDVIDRLKAFDVNFEKLLAPLKKLEK